ncbi:precorrin-8X methylmutase [Rhodovibrio salinarum]|uniref:Precorrin-8X methylmutase n=1 Tax=Rhodovibrio salinarum TaxID=1087 RepID=A0A934V0Y6_9PROT|nr:precorrin-8X methylmutase [Rhodovibrio salinarum]MBK1697589.1 precorrin-8X methylmutase [Rhodovibrio salinarum]
MDYLRDPKAIYAESFRQVRAASDLSRVPAGLESVALRLVHACGMPEVLDDLVWSDDLAASARQALADGAPVLADCRMVAEGVIRSRLPADNAVICTLQDARVPALARELETTRSAAAVELWRDRLAGAVVAVGNAPTALFHLLELLQDGGPKPAAILGFPVGFVGAAESKEALASGAHGVPYLALQGRKGGSALAAAAVNALASESLS